MTSNIINSFFEYINTFCVSGSIAVAVSGGPDSLALTLLLHEWHKNRGSCERFIALTVDHNLQSESAEEARYVHFLVQNLGVAHHILVWQEGHSKGLSNISHRARKARLNLLTDWCKQNGISTLLAHTKNDIVETFFINSFYDK